MAAFYIICSLPSDIHHHSAPAVTQYNQAPPQPYYNAPGVRPGMPAPRQTGAGPSMPHGPAMVHGPPPGAPPSGDPMFPYNSPDVQAMVMEVS